MYIVYSAFVFISFFQHELDNLKDRCSCAEDNLESKRAELEEKCQQADALQEKVFELSSELATYKTDASDPSE